MKPAECQWRLYVDESGEFGNLADDVVVAGLLVRGDAPGPGALRAALSGAAPGISWPLHAAFLDQPVLFALSRLVSPKPLVQDASQPAWIVDAAVADVVRVLSEHAAESFRDSTNFIRRRRIPERSVVRMLDRLVRAEAASAHEVLSDQIKTIWGAVGRGIKALVTHPSNTAAPDRESESRPKGDPAFDGAFLFCAGESARGDAAADPALPNPRLDSTRYLQLLEILFHRVASALARRDGTHRVWLHVLERDIFDDQLNRRWPLHHKHLRAVADRVEPSFGGRVRLMQAHVAKFDSNALPEHVFADFISNRARWILRSKSAPLMAIERQLKGMFLTAVRSGSPPLPHASASGDAARYLQGVLKSLPTPGAGIRRWAYEQAAEWAAVGATSAGLP